MAYPYEANVEPQLRIVLRQLHSLTLREMAVSFPWPTREMAGAEVLPIRSMKPEEKQKWLRQLWGLLREEKGKETARSLSPAPPGERAPSSSRFEAPRQASLRARPRATSSAHLEALSGSVAPSDSLRRSNASKPRSPSPSPARFEQNLAVPNGHTDGGAAGRPTTPSNDEVPLGRLLSINRRPGPFGAIRCHGPGAIPCGRVEFVWMSVLLRWVG